MDIPMLYNINLVRTYCILMGLYQNEKKLRDIEVYLLVALRRIQRPQRQEQES